MIISKLITTTSLKETVAEAASQMDVIGLMSAETLLQNAVWKSHEKETGLYLTVSQLVANAEKLATSVCQFQASLLDEVKKSEIETELSQTMLFLEVLYQLSPDTVLDTWKKTMSPRLTQEAVECVGMRNGNELLSLYTQMGRRDMFLEKLKQELTHKMMEQALI